MTFDEARGVFPVLERYAYLNAGTFGPLAGSTVAAIEREQQRDLEEGRQGREWFDRVMGLRAELRGRIAELLGVDSSTLALTSSTTDGCNIVLGGLELMPGDEIVTTTDEHPGLLLPLGVSPATIVPVPPEPERILAAVTPRTKLIALSHVLWTTGATLPVRELREQSGLPVLVDGAQSVGAIEVDAADLDFLTVSGQKWLCGPDTTGALVVADPERLRIGRPSFLSQRSYEVDGEFVPTPGAARFEPGWIAAGALAGLLDALGLAPEWRFERSLAAAGRCRELLAPLVEVLPGDATLVAFRPPEAEDAASCVRRLSQTGVIVREIPGRELVRASCGWWTSEDDLQRLADAVAPPLRGRRVGGGAQPELFRDRL
jgi:L-cysteine/cystine lyase